MAAYASGNAASRSRRAALQKLHALGDVADDASSIEGHGRCCLQQG